MLVPFLIMLREGVEAALIVGIIAGYLRQTGRGSAMRSVWLGVVLAVLLCLAVGIALDRMSAEFPQKIQEGFEAAVGLLAVIILSAMVFWMRRAGAGMKAELRGRVDAALDAHDQQGWALVAMAFFAVAREGLESVFFLLAAFNQDVGIEAPIGALLGLAAAALIGVGVALGGMRINLRRFFRWTGAFILFVAAGLLASALRSLHEAGLWNHLQAIAFDLGEILPADGILGTLLSGLFGYRDTPTTGELIVYFGFLIPAVALFFRPTGPRERLVPRAARGALGVAVILVAGSAMARAQTAAEPVTVAVTAKACEPAALTVPAGTVTFLIVNKSGRALEWEILKGVMVVDERENIAPGFKQRLTTKLEPGEYDITCGLITNPKGRLTVVDAAGAAPFKPTEIDLVAPAAEYRVWLMGEIGVFADKARALSVATASGDRGEAARLWAEAWAVRRRLAPALGREADATVGDLATIKNGLGDGAALADLATPATALVKHVEELRLKLRATAPDARGMLLGASQVAESIVADPGEAGSRLEGIEKIIQLLGPLTRRADPATGARVDHELTAARALVSTASPSPERDGPALRVAAADLAKSLAEVPKTLGF